MSPLIRHRARRSMLLVLATSAACGPSDRLFIPVPYEEALIVVVSGDAKLLDFQHVSRAGGRCHSRIAADPR